MSKQTIKYTTPGYNHELTIPRTERLKIPRNFPNQLRLITAMLEAFLLSEQGILWLPQFGHYEA